MTRPFDKRVALAAFIGLATIFPAASHAATTPVAVVPVEDFPIPEGLAAPVAFWTGVYATYSTRQVVMHDNRYLHIVYGTLDFTSFARGRTEAALTDLIDDGSEAERERIIGMLMELDSYKEGVPYQKLTPEVKRIHDLFAEVEELDKFRAAADRVRGQRGQREKFMQGIADVAPYMARMEQMFRVRGLPSDLSRLTFVESMFNLHAYSKVGAAGPWQFMSGTGKRFLTISPEIDERMDPLLATDAAARLLGENFEKLGNWGLALTAYNHGVGGMKRAVAEVGSESIEQIVWSYQSRSFGFASRNFYAEFLAARDVYNRREKYFGAALANYPPGTAPVFDEVVLPDHVAMGTLVKFCGVTEDEIRELNPQLTRYVLTGQKYLPKAYPLKVPKGRAPRLVAAYAKIPREFRFAAQKANEFHVVKRGDTLIAIARKYGMSVDSIMDLNALGSRNRLRAGQKLRVLAAEGGKTLVAVSDVKQPAVKVLPAVRLAEDLLPAPVAALEESTLPIPELPDEELLALAAAQAPAMELGLVALPSPATSSAVTPGPMAFPFAAATAGPRGLLSLLVVAGMTPHVAPLSAPAPIAATPVASLAAAPAASIAAAPAAAAAQAGIAPVRGFAFDGLFTVAAVESLVSPERLMAVKEPELEEDRSFADSLREPKAPARDGKGPPARSPAGVRCRLAP